MSDSQLRNKLIRLAHSNPELRPHVLPLLKVAIGRVELGPMSRMRNVLHGPKWADITEEQHQRVSSRRDRITLANSFNNSKHLGLRNFSDKLPSGYYGKDVVAATIFAAKGMVREGGVTMIPFESPPHDTEWDGHLWVMARPKN